MTILLWFQFFTIVLSVAIENQKLLEKIDTQNLKVSNLSNGNALRYLPNWHFDKLQDIWNWPHYIGHNKHIKDKFKEIYLFGPGAHIKFIQMLPPTPPPMPEPSEMMKPPKHDLIPMKPDYGLILFKKLWKWLDSINWKDFWF